MIQGGDTTQGAKIILQNVSEDTITLLVNNVLMEIPKQLEPLMALLGEQGGEFIQIAHKLYNIGQITNANFHFVINSASATGGLPPALGNNLVHNDNTWILSLRRELLKQSAALGKGDWRVFEHYGWLIETYLRKLKTEAGDGINLRRLSFMVETFQISLRYLCYIQAAQILQSDTSQKNILYGLINLKQSDYYKFDFLLLLVDSTAILNDNSAFMPEILDLVMDIQNPRTDLYFAVNFLEKIRFELIDDNIREDQHFPDILNEYFTALVYWLRRISFLAKYKLVSIKEIGLKYRIGTPKNFVHLYAELHGIYDSAELKTANYNERVIEGLYTYNQSVLLFKGNHISACLENLHDTTSYISLSPFIIDESVFAENDTDTPEIYSYAGIDDAGRQYQFIHYSNELPVGKKTIRSNHTLIVKAQNNESPGLDELYEHLEQVFEPFKNLAR